MINDKGEIKGKIMEASKTPGHDKISRDLNIMNNLGD